tara:strand:- start:237 stop:476 length:240 start_codon:yes stop_codon:yes gene_type:complete
MKLRFKRSLGESAFGSVDVFRADGDLSTYKVVEDTFVDGDYILEVYKYTESFRAFPEGKTFRGLTKGEAMDLAQKLEND